MGIFFDCTSLCHHSLCGEPLYCMDCHLYIEIKLKYRSESGHITLSKTFFFLVKMGLFDFYVRVFDMYICFWYFDNDKTNHYRNEIKLQHISYVDAYSFVCCCCWFFLGKSSTIWLLSNFTKIESARCRHWSIF